MIDRDPLTGVLNRTAFNVRLADTINEARATGSGFALLYVDIDNMKHFNAHNGHLVGDQMLKRFVALVEPLLGKQDFLFRVGGDEFAIILPKFGCEESLHLSQQICGVVREKLTPLQPTHCGDRHCMGPAKISVSIGVALFEQNTSSENLLEIAEEKMYEAKCAGRDCFWM